jgi:hypothetical protein
MLTSDTTGLLKDLLRASATDAAGVRENRFRADHPDYQDKIDKLIGAHIQRKDGYLTLRPLAIGEIAPLDQAAADLHAKCARLFDAVFNAVKANPESPIGVADLAARLKINRLELVNVLKYLLDSGIFSTHTNDLNADGANVTPNVSFVLRFKTYEDFIQYLRAAAGITTGKQTGPLIEGAANIVEGAITEHDSNQQPQRIGGKQNTSREAGEHELCLNVDDYAAVIASLFSGADRKEFCLALYGFWGRGKSFLMRRVAKVLENTAARYQTVNFSAWKYPSSPEVWVHLYEEFAEAALRGPWYQTLPIAVRTSIAKRGPGKLLAAFALFALGVFPIAHLLQWTAQAIVYLYPVLGLMGFIWIWSFVRGVHKTNARLTATYLTATRHTEKLGLQATIGADFAALLKGWMPVHGFGPAFNAAYWLISLILASGTWLRLQSGRALETLADGQLSFQLVVSANPWLSALITGLVSVLCVAAIVLLRHGGSPPSRALLVVDDLDRCKPEHLLSVMESIKLLIEDEEISQRVQVAMLLEEDILRHAIFVKYGALTDDNAKLILRAPYDIERLMRENCEKLFTAHLRLPSLGSSELRDLVESFSGRRARMIQRRKEAQAKRETLQKQMNSKPDMRVYSGKKKVEAATRMVRGEPMYTEKEVDAFRDATKSEAEQITQEHERRKLELKPMIDELEGELNSIAEYISPSEQSRRDSSSIDETQVLDDSEVDAIIDALVTENKVPPKYLGPRAVRAFLFRYQLARLLLERLGIRWSATMLARELAAQYGKPSSSAFEDVEPVTSRLTSREKLRRIVDQVS